MRTYLIASALMFMMSNSSLVPMGLQQLSDMIKNLGTDQTQPTQCGTVTCTPDQNCINGVCQDTAVDVNPLLQNPDSNETDPSEKTFFSMPLDDGNTPNLASENTPNQTSEDKPNLTSEDTPNLTSEDTLNLTSEDTPNQKSEPSTSIPEATNTPLQVTQTPSISSLPLPRSLLPPTTTEPQQQTQSLPLPTKSTPPPPPSITLTPPPPPSSSQSPANTTQPSTNSSTPATKSESQPKKVVLSYQNILKFTVLMLIMLLINF